MIMEQTPLSDKVQTSQKIKELINKFHTDLNSIFVVVRGNSQKITSLSLSDFFDFVRTIKYRRDPRPVEVVARPYYLFKYRDLGLDCKKKSIICGAYFKNRGLPFRFIGSSDRPDGKIHHIFPQVKIDNEYLNFDATYSNYKLFEPKQVTKWEVL